MKKYKVKTKHKISRRYNAYLDKDGDVGGYSYWFMLSGTDGDNMEFDTKISAHWVNDFGTQVLESDAGWFYVEEWLNKLED